MIGIDFRVMSSFKLDRQHATEQGRYEMNRQSQMQEGKNWFFPKEINANWFFGDSHWLEIWKNHFCPLGPNGGSVALDSALAVRPFMGHYSCTNSLVLISRDKEIGTNLAC